MSSSVTAANDAVAKFIRPEKYHIDIYPKEGTTLSSSIPTIHPQYTLSQYNNPVLKLTISETDGEFSVTSPSPTTVTYTGRPNTYASKLRHIASTKDYFSLSYTLTASSGSLYAISGSTGTPVWSSTEAYDVSSSTASDWTNSVPADNGGTDMEIFNIKVSTLGTGSITSATITADVLIKKWGTKDVTMDLNLDRLIEAK